MASLRDIQRRIRAVQDTQKVTRAMKLVAAAKLRRAQQEALDARAYASGLHDAVQRISKRLGPRAPVMWRRPQRIECLDVLVISSDRGFCGGFNENLFRAVEEGYVEHAMHYIDIKFYVLGRQGERYFRGRDLDVEFVPTGRDSREVVSWVLSRMIGRYCDGESAGGYVAFNRFVTAAHHEVAFWNLLPLYEHGDPKERNLEYEYEPGRQAALDYLTVEMLITSIRQALLESRASELGARLTAMDASTRNADDMVAHLTALYNRRRQEAITRELMDIVGGAEALRQATR